MSDDLIDTPIGEDPGPPVLSDMDLPDDPGDAVPVLLELLSEARDLATARLDDLQRVAAEFENYRKRSDRERDEIRQRATQRLVEALLPVLDSFDGAFSHEPQTPGEELLMKGFSGTFHQLFEILQREGLEVVEAAGLPFDPSLHQAVSGGAGDDLTVSAELRRGYALRGRVIRPTMVAVAPVNGDGEADPA
jgi:molecular chaperone GrpE